MLRIWEGSHDLTKVQIDSKVVDCKLYCCYTMTDSLKLHIRDLFVESHHNTHTNKHVSVTYPVKLEILTMKQQV